MSFVWVLNPKGRQIKVKTNPTQTVLSVIEEVASKSELDPDKFDIVTSIQRRPIDPSQQWRFCSIPNNAKLELIPSVKGRSTKSVAVKVGMQTPTGRVVGTASTDMTIYNVFKELKIEYPAPDQFPVVSFSGKECELRKTLKEIGVLSGNVLLRVHFRTRTEEDSALITELENEVSQPKMKIQRISPTPSVSPLTKTPIAQNSPTELSSDSNVTVDRLPSGAPAVFNNFKFPENTQPMEVMSSESTNRLPNGQKAEFSDFKFPDKADLASKNVGPKTVASTSHRLPNGQKAQFSNFKFDSNKNESKDETEPEKKEELYPFRNFKFPEQSTSPTHLVIDGSSMETDKNEDLNDTDTNLPVFPPADRMLRVYNIREIKSNSDHLMDVDDSIFEVTTNDVKRMQASFAQKEKSLLTRSLRIKREKEQMLSDFRNHPECGVKINFQNNSVMEMLFHPGESISAIIAAVRANLIDAEPFDIFITPPKLILNPNSTIWSNGLCPRGNVYASLPVQLVKYRPEIWTKRLTELKPAINPESTNSSIPGTSGLQSLDTDKTSLEPTSSNAISQSVKPVTDKYSSRSDGKKVPKWFKGTGKSYK